MIRRNLMYIIAFLLFFAWLVFIDYIEHNSLDFLSNAVQSLLVVIFMRLFNWFTGSDNKRKESKTEK